MSVLGIGIDIVEINRRKKILRQNRVLIYGVVLNGPINTKNAESIEHFGKVKVLTQIPFFKKVSLKKIKNFTNKNSLKIFKP